MLWLDRPECFELKWILSIKLSFVRSKGNLKWLQVSDWLLRVGVNFPSMQIVLFGLDFIFICFGMW